MHARAALALLLVLAPLSLQRERVEPTPPPPQSDDLPEWPGSRSRERNDALVEKLQGCWRLDALEAVGREAPQDKEIGYMLVAGQHLSIEIHGDWRLSTFTPSKSGKGPSLSGRLSTGVHRFELDAWQQMTTRTLIGTHDGLDGRIEFERPDTTRRFQVDLSGDRLVLTRDDGTVLRFERVADGKRKVDFYGRPLVEPPPVPEGPTSDEGARQGDEPAPDGGAPPGDEPR